MVIDDEIHQLQSIKGGKSHSFDCWIQTQIIVHSSSQHKYNMMGTSKACGNVTWEAGPKLSKESSVHCQFSFLLCLVIGVLIKDTSYKRCVGQK